eukprot:1195491-Prorocentrum_minimum.AAC.2
MEATRGYERLLSKQLVGVHVGVWVRAELVAAISDVRACSVKTGWGGMLGNKVSQSLKDNNNNNKQV